MSLCMNNSDKSNENQCIVTGTESIKQTKYLK